MNEGVLRMTLVRQLPELTLRGSIANITMANLTTEQKTKVEEIFQKVRSHKALQRNRAQVMKGLGATIRGDFAEKIAAEQEYDIAIWRGVVNILYHKDYTFKCSHCAATTYLTQRGKPKPIDRQQIPCPSCKMAVVDNPGCSNYQHGQVVNHQQAQNDFKSFRENTPTFKSTIEYQGGTNKYLDPDKILEDEEQTKKFFSEFVWNYFRQQIKENKRKSNKTQQEVSGPADQMILEMLISTCVKLKVDYSCDRMLFNGCYTIQVPVLQTSPEFSIDLAFILEVANQNGITIRINQHSIDVLSQYSAPSMTVTVVKSEHVTMVEDQNTQEDGEATGFSVSQVSHRTVSGGTMDQEDHETNYDLIEAFEKTRDSLPDNDCKRIFDIYRQEGCEYDAYCNLFEEDGMPKIKNVAKMLNITTRAVKQHRETIRVYCLSNGFVPEKV